MGAAEKRTSRRSKRAEQAEQSVGRILDAATELFAAHGFAGVSTRQIAGAAGLNIATVNHHMGSKRDVFVAVIERFFDEEAALLGEALVEAPDETLADFKAFEGLILAFVDRLIAFSRDNPNRQKLYLRRWLDGQDELAWREAELTLELYGHFRSLLERAQALGSVNAGLDIGYFLRTFDWMVVAYFTSGAFDWESLRADPRDDENLGRFRDYLRAYTRAMLRGEGP